MEMESWSVVAWCQWVGLGLTAAHDGTLQDSQSFLKPDCRSGCLAKFMNFLYVNCIHFMITLFLDYFQILWLLRKNMFLLCFHILKYEHVGNPLNPLNS